MSENVASPFSRFEWDVLLKAPVIVFLMVAAMDGKVETKEVKGFLTVLLDAAGCDDVTVRALFLESGAKFPQILPQILSASGDSGRTLIDVKNIIDEKLAPEAAMHFKQCLVVLGKQVAEISGEASKAAKAALAAIATILYVQV